MVFDTADTTSSTSQTSSYAAVARRGSMSGTSADAAHFKMSTAPASTPSRTSIYSDIHKTASPAAPPIFVLPTTPTSAAKAAAASKASIKGPSLVFGKPGHPSSDVPAHHFPISPPATDPRKPDLSFETASNFSPFSSGDDSFANTSFNTNFTHPDLSADKHLTSASTSARFRPDLLDSPVPARARNESHSSSISATRYSERDILDTLHFGSLSLQDSGFNSKIGSHDRGATQQPSSTQVSPSSSTRGDSSASLSSGPTEAQSAENVTKTALKGYETRDSRSTSYSGQSSYGRSDDASKSTKQTSESSKYKSNTSNDYNKENETKNEKPRSTLAGDQASATLTNTETRYLFVSGLPSMPDYDVKEMIEAFKKYAPMRGVFGRALYLHGVVILSYHDTRNAQRAHRAIHLDSNPAFHYRKVEATFITREQFIQIADGYFTNKLLSVGEGKLLIKGSIFNSTTLEEYFRTFGDVKQFTYSDTEAGVFHLEYFDDTAACKAFKRLTESSIPGLDVGWQDVETLNEHLRAPQTPSDLFYEKVVSTQPLQGVTTSSPTQVKYLSPHRREQYGVDTKVSASSAYAADLRASNPASPYSTTFSHPSTPARSSVVSADSPSRPESSYSEYILPSGFTPARSSAHQGSFSPIPALEGVYVPNDHRNPYPSSNAWGLLRDDPIPAGNVIHFDKIFSGDEKRTSCILRNLPNRMTQLELMENLDEIVPREYDFVYLRFDFQSGSNCGFGFVNFISMSALLRFWNARLGKMWDKENSRKMVMGGFANIQGKTALVERFRNSSVMDQHPDYRPKIFWSSGPQKGLPEPFPMSNNSLRKARSTYATGMYGLYGSRPKGGFRPVPVQQ